MDDTSSTTRCGQFTRLAGVLVAAGVGLAGCQPYIGTTAASFLQNAQSRDPNIRYLAYAKLASSRCYDGESQKAEAVQALGKKLEAGHEPVASRAVICRTLGEIGRPEARPALLRAVNDPEGVVRAEACRALGKVGRAEDATALARIMSVDTLEDCRIAAIEGLGALQTTDVRIMRLLAEGMEHQDPAIRLASLQALRKLTKKDLGVEPTPWRKYIVELAENEEKTASKPANSDRRPAKPAAPEPKPPTGAPDAKADPGVLPVRR